LTIEGEHFRNKIKSRLAVKAEPLRLCLCIIAADTLKIEAHKIGVVFNRAVKQAGKFRFDGLSLVAVFPVQLFTSGHRRTEFA
jgi:hypothetical protein